MTFEKYNANPENKNIGDCSIRAICTATPLTYQQAKKLLETKVFESGAAWNTVKNITAALADLGISVERASREPDPKKEEEKKMDWKKIFAACETIEELKKAFKKACMSCHPDKGGTAAEFKAMSAAHDKRAAELAESESRQEWQRNKKADGTYKTAAEILAEQAEFAEILAVLMGLKGLEIEICGNWLWIGGETKENKDALKGAGCKWASKKKLWYWHAGEWVKKVRRALTMEQIRDLHGSEFLKYRPETPLLQ